MTSDICRLKASRKREMEKNENRAALIHQKANCLRAIRAAGKRNALTGRLIALRLDAARSYATPQTGRCAHLSRPK